MSTFELWFLLMLLLGLGLLGTVAALVSIVLEQAARIRAMRRAGRVAS